MIQSELEIRIGIHRPQELTEQSLREYLLDFDFVSFAPSHADTRIVIVGLARPKGYLLSFVFFLQNFYIADIVLYSLEIFS